MDSPDNSSTLLVIAIVQAQDAESAIDALKKTNLTSFQLPSTGGFLGLRNVTLLIQSTTRLWNTVLQVLKQTCKQRIDYAELPLDGRMAGDGPFLTPVTVGGATLFSVEVEQFEEV